MPNRFGGRENIEAVAFLRHLNEIVHAEHPGVMMIAEESTAWPAVSRPVYAGGLGFTYKWNMGWMHDILTYMQKDPVHRQWEHRHLTFSMLYAFNENFVLPFSHDEVVHGKGSMIGKMPGDDWQKAANLRALYAYMFVHPGKKLLFMGSELAAWREWDDGDGLPWAWADDAPHAGVRQLVRDLNRALSRAAGAAPGRLPADRLQLDRLRRRGAQRHLADPPRRARRRTKCSPSSTSRRSCARATAWACREPGRYRELINTDAEVYGGGNVGNAGGLETEPIAGAGHGAVAGADAAAARRPDPEARLTREPRCAALPRPIRSSPRSSRRPAPLGRRRRRADADPLPAHAPRIAELRHHRPPRSRGEDASTGTLRRHLAQPVGATPSPTSGSTST